MKLTAKLAIAVLVLCASCWATPALVNSCVVGNEANTASITTPSCIPPAGSFVIITTTAVRPFSTLTISDLCGDTFVNANATVFPFHDSIQDGDLYIWYIKSAIGCTPNTFTTIPSSGSSALEIHVSWWTGMSGWAPDQTSVANAATGGTSFNSGSKTTTKNGELIFGYTFPFGHSSPGAGFTGITLVNGDWDEYQVQPTAGSVSATFTSDSPSTWLAAMQTFASPCPDPINNAGYVRVGAGGSNNGTSWTNAFTSIPATLVRGCTYYLAVGSYGSYNLSTANSGTTPITIQSATVANHGIATGWLDTFAGQAVFTGIERVTDHWILDGATGGGPPDWACTTCGIKISMPVSGGQSHAFGDSGSTTITDITLRHMDIQGRGRAYTGGDTDLVYFVSDAYNGFTVDHCYMHDTDRTMFLTWPSAGSGMTIQYSYIAKNGAAEHREAWSFSNDSNVIIRYNLFEEIFGTGVLAAVNNAGTASNWQVNGNVFYWTGPYSDVNGTGLINTGVIVVAASNCPTLQCIHTSGWTVTNNVVANIVSGSFLSAFDFESVTGSLICENNIWYNNNASSGPGPSGCGAGTDDYNWFFGNTPTNNTSGAHDVVGTSSPFNAGTNANFPNGNWTLKASIPGLAQAGYTADMLGNTFAPNWDRGALVFQSLTPAPVVSLASSSVNCGNSQIGVQVACSSVLLTNTGNATLNISSIAVAGTNTGDFSQANTCGSTVASGANCSITPSFTPTAGGVRSASINITDDATGSPQSIALSGNGGAPVASLAPSSLTFGSLNVSTSSAAQTLTLSNTGTSALSITSISLTGSNPGDYFQSNNCPVGSSLGTSSSCTITVTFTPLAVGARSASVSVVDGASGSPHTSTLSGTGVQPLISGQANPGARMSGRAVLK